MAATFALILHELLLIVGKGCWTVGFAWRLTLMESV
jgi:hypothetical protein